MADGSMSSITLTALIRFDVPATSQEFPHFEGHFPLARERRQCGTCKSIVHFLSELDLLWDGVKARATN